MLQPDLMERVLPAAAEADVDAWEFAVSPPFIDFLARWLDGATFTDEAWPDQQSELLSSALKSMRKRAEMRLQRVITHEKARAAIDDVWRIYRELCAGRSDALAEIHERFEFVAVVGIPRTGGSYLTAELFAALGYDPRCVPATIAHDGFPDAGPFSLSPGVNSWIGTLLGVSDGAVSIFDYLSYWYGGLLFGAATLATGVILVIRGLRRGYRPRQVIPLPILLQSAFLVLVFFGVSFDLAFAARFLLSRAALQEADGEIRSGHRRARPGWIGLFQIREVNTAGSAVRFITGECFMDDCGFAFNSEGEPPRVGEDSYVHIEGSSWYWHRSW